MILQIVTKNTSPIAIFVFIENSFGSILLPFVILVR